MDDKKINPRMLNTTDAAKYLGVGANLFRRNIRPYLAEVKIGKRPYFEIIELEHYIEEQKKKSIKPVKKYEERQKWERKERQDCSSAASIGTSKKQYAESLFAKALEQAR